MKNRLELTCVLKCSLSWVHLIVTTLFRRSTGVHIRGGVPLVVAAAWSSSAAAPAAVGSVGGAGEAAASATEVAVARAGLRPSGAPRPTRFGGPPIKVRNNVTLKMVCLESHAT